MKKCINIAIGLQLIIMSYVNAQMYDANWVFGKNAKLFFNTNNNNIPQLYSSKSNNSELNACIGDEQGNLLLYLSHNDSTNKFDIIASTDSVIINGDNIHADQSSTNGGIILPITNNSYVVFTTNFYRVGCPFVACNNLYHTFIEKNVTLQPYVSIKNKIYLSSEVEEKIGAIYHGDGRSWIIYTHANQYSQLGCNNRYYYTHLSGTTTKTDSVIFNSQDKGTIHCGLHTGAGELVFSLDGNLMADVLTNQNKVDLFSVNRCSGELELITTIENVIKPYGIEFSPSGKYLYIASGYPVSSNPSYLYQVDLTAPNINASVQLIYTHHSALVLGQLQRAPNGKIYGAWGGGLGPNFAPDSAISSSRRTTHYLAVINNPDSAGLNCDFQVRGLFLGDSASTTLGLPNFPNYRLGALSIYEADAGRDTVLCIDSTVNQKVVVLGTAPINGVQYQWYPNYNLSSDTAAQPLAFPDSTTMYYVMLSDTTIANACKTRLDSVYVEVKKCISSAHGQLSTVYSVKVFPNPASSEIKIQSEKHKIQNVSIYDVAGKALLSPFEGGVCSHCEQAGDEEMIINIKELSQGIYFIRTQLANGQTTINKLVKQ